MPLTITPTACLTKWMAAAIDALAVSTASQTFLGAANATEAEERIHFFGTPKPADGAHYTDDEWNDINPFISLLPPDDGAWFSRTKIATGASFIRTFWLQLRFQRMIPNGLSENDAVFQLADTVLKIVEQLENQSDNLGGWGFDYDAGLQAPVRVSPRDSVRVGDAHFMSVHFRLEETV